MNQKAQSALNQNILVINKGSIAAEVMLHLLEVKLREVASIQSEIKIVHLYINGNNKNVIIIITNSIFVTKERKSCASEWIF